MRNQKSGYKVWVSLLDHFSYGDQALHNLQIQNKVKSSGHKVAAIHADISSMKRYVAAVERAYDWVKDNLNLDQEPDFLMSFSTGLFSKDEENSVEVSPDCALEIGNTIQESFDGGCFTEKN